MRPIVVSASLIALSLSLSGCVGVGTFLDQTFTLPGANPNIPQTDSENIRRVLGQSLDQQPLTPEPGNVWPSPARPEPTLQDIQANPAGTPGGGNPGSGNPDAGQPSSQNPSPNGGPRQPRRSGSSTPPQDLGTPATTAPTPGVPPPPPPPRSFNPPNGPVGGVVNTPTGPAFESGGTGGYRTLTTPQGGGAILVPNGNGTSTVINPNGSVQTIPTPR